MNKLYKAAIGLAAASTLLLAGTALAAGTITFLTLNGQPNATVPLGNTAQANVTYDLTTGSDAESLSWQIIDSAGNAALPPVCVDIIDRNTAGTFNTSFPIGTGGQNEGTYDIRTRLYGQSGAGADNNCNGAVLSTNTFANRITITTPADSSTQTGNPFNGNSNGYCALFPGTCLNNNTGNTGNTGYNGTSPFGGTSLPVFCATYPALCGVNPTTPAPTPTPTPTPAPVSAKCALITPFLGAAPYAYSSLGTQLQSVLLLDNPHSIPALDNSLHPNGTVPMGFFGIQTHAALTVYMTTYHCV